MIHNRLKFTSQLISPRGWMVRSFGLAFESTRVSIPATGSYCLATLMSSDRTKQICLWMPIYIIIISCRKLWFPQHTLCLSVSLSIRFDRLSLLAGLPNCILCPSMVVVDKFFLVVQHLPVRGKGSIGERRLWARPYFSTSVPHVWHVWFALF